eukprot:1149663-Pelagomonas_calceolata.AAC.2
METGERENGGVSQASSKLCGTQAEGLCCMRRPAANPMIWTRAHSAGTMYLSYEPSMECYTADHYKLMLISAAGMMSTADEGRITCSKWKQRTCILPLQDACSKSKTHAAICRSNVAQTSERMKLVCCVLPVQSRWHVVYVWACYVQSEENRELRWVNKLYEKSAGFR